MTEQSSFEQSYFDELAAALRRSGMPEPEVARRPRTGVWGGAPPHHAAAAAK